MKRLHKYSIFLFLPVLAVVVVAVSLIAKGKASDAHVLHTEPSSYAPVVVFEQYGERCMSFETMDSEGRQTCFQLDDPDKMVFAYTRMMTSALLAKPDSAAILIIGLGGGTLPTALHKLLPQAVIDTVEIDPAVLRVAQDYFGFETSERQRVHIKDGRAFVEQAHRQGRHYDMVMLDAFDVDYIPPHLLTFEFLQHVRSILTPDGLVVANSFAQSQMHERESATYAAVFGAFFDLRTELAGNRVIIASSGDLPDDAMLQGNAVSLAEHLRPFGIDVGTALERFSMTRYEYEADQVLRDAR